MIKNKEEFYSFELNEPKDPFSAPAVDPGKIRESGEYETMEEALAAGAEEIMFRFFTNYGNGLGNSAEDEAIRARYYRYIEYLAERSSADIVSAYEKFLRERDAAGDFYSDIAGKVRDFYEKAMKEKPDAIADNAEISGPAVEFNFQPVKNSDKLVELLKTDILKEKIISGVPAVEFFQQKVKAISRMVIVTGLFGSETDEKRFFYDLSDASAAFVEEFSRSVQTVASGIWELILAEVREFLAGIKLELDRKLENIVFPVHMDG